MITEGEPLAFHEKISSSFINTQAMILIIKIPAWFQLGNW